MVKKKKANVQCQLLLFPIFSWGYQNPWGWYPVLIISKLFSVFPSPVTHFLCTFLSSHHSISATAMLFWQSGESTAGVMQGWGFPQGKEPVGWRGGDFQTHRCCWILVLWQEVWAHGSKLFILWTRPACLCLTRPLQSWSALFDAAAPSYRLNRAVELWSCFRDEPHWPVHGRTENAYS